MEFFDGFAKIKYYIMVISALFVWFLWGTITGTRILGDDDQLREERNTAQRLGGFHHK